MRILEGALVSGQVATTDYVTDWYDVKHMAGLSAQAQWTVDSSANKTAADTAFNLSANTVDITAHGFQTGRKVTLTTSGAALPAPLATATTYYVIRVDANTIQLATSYANAVAGTAIDITDRGTALATTTFIPTALSSTYVLEWSNDKVLAATLFTAVAVSATGSDSRFIADMYGLWVRAKLSVTSGQLSGVGILISGKGV